MLPKKINANSKINIVFLSSPVPGEDKNYFVKSQKKLKQIFRNVNLFDLEHRDDAPPYLAGSEDERIAKFKNAISDADWIIPAYGGTGCEDIVRHLARKDLKILKKNRPVINGFSDAAYILNYLYFKLRITTFHYVNECGLFVHKNSRDFLDIITGRREKLEFQEKAYDWTLGYTPDSPINGLAIGGNISTFRDVLNVSHIKVRFWDKYILFMEDIGLDEEDFHRLIVELDEKGVFEKIKALVVGSFTGTGEKFTVAKFKRSNAVFGTRLDLLEYLLKKVIAKRLKKKNPLHILKINNFGHNNCRNPIILPLGAKTVIHPEKKIEFIGPFVA